MSFIRLHSPTRRVQVRSGVASGQATDVACVEKLNMIMENLGVSPSRRSAQLHSHPEVMHLISPQDLAYLAQEARLLTHHRDVKCDFNALCMILWANLARVGKLLDETVTEVSAAVGSGNTRALIAQLSGEPGLSPARLASLCSPSLAAASRVAVILCAFEEPTARADNQLAREVRVSAQDIDMAVRLTQKLARLMHELVSTAAEAGLSVVKHYDAVGHRLLRVAEVCLSSLWRLLAAVASRKDTECEPVLALLNDELQWRLSGIGALATESYCEAVIALAQTLFVRRGDFDNGDEVAARILFDRLAQRPPFHWGTYKLLHFTVRAFRAVVTTATEPPRCACFGAVSSFAHVRRAVERGLTLEGAAAASVSALPPPPGGGKGRASPKAAAAAAREAAQRREAGVVGCRRALSRLLAGLANDRDAHSAQKKDTPLTFSQLLVLAAVNGMPEADLVNDEALVQRAQATKLADTADATAAVEIMDPDFLRLLMGYAYTIPTSHGSVEHAPLTDASAIALYKAVAKYFFQMPAFEEARGGSQPMLAHRVNPLFAHPLLAPHALLDVVVKRCGAETPPPIGDEDSAPGAPGKESSVPALPDTRASALAATLQKLIGVDVACLYDASDRLHELSVYDTTAANNGGSSHGVPSFSSSLFSIIPEPMRAVTALTSTLLFLFYDDPAFLKRVSLPAALDTLARVYALAATAVPTRGRDSATLRGIRQRILSRMQRRLADVPQKMATSEVRRVLMERLLVLAQPAKVDRPNQLRLALVEAYLRAMATSTAAFSVHDALMVAHWVDIALPCLTSRYSAALAVAGHDFFIAPLIAQKAISPLFVPTYVAVLIPTGAPESNSGLPPIAPGFPAPASSKYGEPAMALLKHFATSVRAACQGLERCDATALQQQLDDESSVVARCLAANAGGATSLNLAALRKLTPTNAVLLVASALFDKLCQLWNTDPGVMRDAQQRFATYFSALANLLQCTSTQVLHRVCASIEAIEVEHLRGAGQAQLQFLKYVGLVVDNVRGNSKKGVAEWYLRLSDKVMREGKRTSKL